MNVRPTNSGTIVQARAHVLIGSLEPVCCAAWTFLKTLKSTNGPFLLERLIQFFRNATEGVPYRVPVISVSVDRSAATYGGGRWICSWICGACGSSRPWQARLRG